MMIGVNTSTSGRKNKISNKHVAALEKDIVIDMAKVQVFSAQCISR